MLANYTTYDTYFRIEKAVAEDPEYVPGKAKAAIARFVSLHPHNLAQKAQNTVLFHLASALVPTYTVIDRDGAEQVHTSSLGVAMTAARRVLAEQGEVWVRASDDTCAHIDPRRVASDTPSCPWIQSIAASLEATS